MRLIDADKLLQEIEFEYDLDYGETLINPRDFADAVCDSPTVDAVPVSELIALRDTLYDMDAITFRGLAKINQLIAKYGGQGISTPG